MCDCYGHQCEICGELISMHIADFAYSRKAFRVWCGDHVRHAPVGAVIFTVIVEGDEYEPVGWKCAMLGPEVGREKGNHPNIWGQLAEEKKQ